MINTMSKHRTLDQSFFSKWTPAMAYVLGYFAADGSMIENKRGGHFIEFTSTDAVLIENLQAVTGSNHRVAVRVRGGNSKIAYRLQIGSNKWFRDLEKLGFTPSKSTTLRFPKMPTSFLGDFIRGYFDGDGCVYSAYLKYADRNQKRWTVQTLFTSGSLGFLRSLHNILKSHGVRGGSIKSKLRGYELVFSHQDSLALYQLMYHTGPVSDLYLPRKREKLEQAIRVLKLRA